MILNDMIYTISDSTLGWNVEIKKIIDRNNEIIKLTFLDSFGPESPYLHVKLTDRQLRRIIQKNKNSKWQEKLLTIK